MDQNGNNLDLKSLAWRWDDGTLCGPDDEVILHLYRGVMPGDVNARLMEATPVLLAALKHVREWIAARVGPAAVESCLPEIDLALGFAGVDWASPRT